MASLYERFLADGPVRSLMNGREFSCSRNEGRLPALKLAGIFRSTEADCSFKRLKRLERMVSDSDTGRLMLETAKADGTSIHLDSSVKNCCGFYLESENAVCLNAGETDAVLASTLVHEVRHAWQAKQPVAFNADLRIKPLFMAGFAVEADALAIETLFAFEMKDKHPEIWGSLEKSKYACVAKAFKDGLGKTNRIVSGLESAFASWYDTPVVPLYADDYIKALDQMSASPYGEERCFLSKDVSPAQIADSMCRFNKDVYLQNPCILETPEKLHLQPHQKERLDKILINWAEKTHRSDNVGSEALFVKEKNGAYTAGKKLNVPKATEAPLWLQKLKAAERF